MAEFLIKLRNFKCKISIPYLIFLLFVISGCSYHIIQLMQLYLKFETKVGVSYHYKNEFAVPIISLCWEAKYLLKNYSETTSTEGMSLDHIYNKTKDFGDVIINMGYDFKNAWVNIYNFSEYEINTLTGKRNKAKYYVKFKKTIIRGFGDKVCYNLIHPEITLNKSSAVVLFSIDLNQQFNIYLFPRNNAQSNPNGNNMITLDSMFNIFNCFNFNQFISQKDGFIKLHFQ